MRLFKCLFVAAVVIFILEPGAPAIAQQEPRYAWFELPTVDENIQFDAPDSFFGPREFVTGGSLVSSVGGVPVVWDMRNGGQVHQLETLGAGGGAGNVNDHGDFMGGSDLPGNTAFHAVIYENFQIRDLGTLGGLNSTARDINNVPQVVGESEYDMNNSRDKAPFVWEDGEMRELPNLGLRIGAAFGINNAGDIVGILSIQDGEDFFTFPILWVNGETIEILPYPDSRVSNPAIPTAINDEGIIVGTIIDPIHAAAWVNGKLFDIHDRRIGSWSNALDINNKNQIVGVAGTCNCPGKAFVAELGMGMVPLKDLIPPRLRLPWKIESPRTISDTGQITISAQFEPGDLWAVLLSPVNPTMMMSEPTPGVAGELNTFEVTNAKPGAKVVFTYSRHGGGFRIPGCNLQKNALQLHEPKVVGSATADANGNASIERFVPGDATGKTILFQAVVVNDCAISQLTGITFE